MMTVDSGSNLAVLSRISVRETEEHDVVAREDFDGGLFEYAAKRVGAMRMMLTERRTGVATGGQRTDHQTAVGVGGCPRSRRRTSPPAYPWRRQRRPATAAHRGIRHVMYYARSCKLIHTWVGNQ